VRPTSRSQPPRPHDLRGTVPAVTASYSGFVNGDTAASLTTRPTARRRSRRPARWVPTPQAARVRRRELPHHLRGGHGGSHAANLTITASSVPVTYGKRRTDHHGELLGLRERRHAASLTTQPICTTASAPPARSGPMPRHAAGGLWQLHDQLRAGVGDRQSGSVDPSLPTTRRRPWELLAA